MNADLQLQATLYCLHRKQLYVNYMRGARLLATYIPPDSTNIYSSWIPTPSDSNSMAADMCSNCGCYFGSTLGGRLRDSCYYCRSRASAISRYEIQELAVIWNCSQEFAEFLLASALDSVYRHKMQNPTIQSAFNETANATAS